MKQSVNAVQENNLFSEIHTKYKGKAKVHPCTGTEAMYRPYDP